MSTENQNAKIRIVFSSARLLVVDKPEGLSVHNNEDSTNLLKLLAKQELTEKLFPVHRLDKETSGIQIFARTELAAREVAERFQSREVAKQYSGVLRGSLNQDGIWNAPLTDKAEGRREPRGQATGRVPCETRYRVRERSKYFTLCEFDLITGRQHQIRKHAAISSHALVGDARYGDKPYNEKMFRRYGFNRMLLHCERVELEDQGLQIFKSPRPQLFDALLRGEGRL